jgi:hypothetical protein
VSLATGPRRVMSADAPLKHGLRGLAHDGACVLRLLGNRSDRPLQDVAVSPGHGPMLGGAADWETRPGGPRSAGRSRREEGASRGSGDATSGIRLIGKSERSATVNGLS